MSFITDENTMKLKPTFQSRVTFSALRFILFPNGKLFTKRKCMLDREVASSLSGIRRSPSTKGNQEMKWKWHEHLY